MSSQCCLFGLNTIFLFFQILGIMSGEDGGGGGGGGGGGANGVGNNENLYSPSEERNHYSESPQERQWKSF